jgi:transcriptional regulator with XRE-family HTH domain
MGPLHVNEFSTGLYGSDFSRVFSKLLEKANVSCYAIGAYTGLDQAYLSRLKSGVRTNPSPETIMKIGLALSHLSNRISLSDIDDLFRSVGRSLRTG